MAVINVTEEAHAEAKARAQELGISLSQYASLKLTEVPAQTIQLHELLEPFAEMAEKRSETLPETLKAALEALIAPKAVVTPTKASVAVWEDGLPACRCDGTPEYGPWHKTSCHRRT